MILQFFSLGWDIPDLIVPTPRNKKSSDSWEIRKALAQHIGNMLQRPVNTQIFLDPSLLISPRKTLEWQKSPSHVALKTHSKFSEKNILIVHDLHISGYAELSTAQFLKRNNSSYIMSMSCLGPSENC
jgi:predicted amidophosphoribosyltransferase